jgi:hypothetical protein
VPELARAIIEMLALQLDGISERIDEVDTRINAWHKANPVSQRLATIPGIGPLVAACLQCLNFEDCPDLRSKKMARAGSAGQGHWGTSAAEQRNRAIIPLSAVAVL